MSHHSHITALFFCFLLIACVPAAGDEVRVLPEKSYRLDLLARKPDETGFTQDTRTVTPDIYLDKQSNRLFYVGEGKALAVVPPGQGRGGAEVKAAKRLHRLVLPVRKWDEEDFGKSTPKISVEVYHDVRAGNWVYVSHTGAMAAIPADKAPVEKPAQDRRWLYRLPLKVRHFDKFAFEYYRHNIEVYRDERTGLLIYVSESGGLAVLAAAKAEEGRETLPPVWSHAQELKARNPGDKDFHPKTPSFGMEIYQDKNRGAWVYVTETAQLAVLPQSGAIEPKDAKAPVWSQRLGLPGAEGKKWSAEVYHNPNADHVMVITANGALAVVPVK